MDKQQYVSEGLRQLNSKHYMEITQPDLGKLNNIIHEKLSEMLSKGSLDKETYRFLTCNQPISQYGCLYLLPKIHKIEGTILNALTLGLCSLRQLPPARPIISQCNTPTYNIGAYCDHFLVPIVQTQSTYIQDTRDFISKIEALNLPPGAILITYDVTSMYTNIEFDEILSAVRVAYENAHNSPSEIPYPETSDLVFLINTILENNYFEFNGKYYKQIIGVSMGSSASPELSDIRMYQITNYIMSQFRNADKVLFHGRYRDDGFIIFDGTNDQIIEFFNIGNSCHKHLKFTFEISDTSIDFLDTTVYKGKRFHECNILDIKSYIKPTNNFQYLHRQSAHSPSVFKGFIQGECIRHLRNTSDISICSNILENFKLHLLKRGYSNSEIEPILRKTKASNRSTTALKRNYKSKTKTPLVMVTKFNPSVKGLKRRILKYWNEMKCNSSCTHIFETEPIIAYSKHKNIGDIIIRSKL